MNAEQFKASWDQLKGSLQREWGNLTDEDLAWIAGDQPTFQRVLASRYGAQSRAVSQWADRWYARWAGWYEGYEELHHPQVATEQRRL